MADKPTDDELAKLFTEETGFDADDSPAAILDFARAVLAKWGQPSGAGEVVAVPLTDEQRSDIATAAAGFNWTDDYVEAIDYVIDGVESLHGIKGDQQ